MSGQAELLAGPAPRPPQLLLRPLPPGELVKMQILGLLA